MTQAVIGVFDTPEAARNAGETLVNRGIDQSCVHLTAHETAYGSAGGSPDQGQQGGTMGGIRNFFSELFGTEHSEEASRYSEALRRGSVMLTVDVPDGTSVEPVRNALLDAGAIDIDERVEQWRQQGWSSYNPESRPYSADEIARERSTVLPVIREDIEVGKRAVGKGTVRVYSRTVETPVRENVTLREEHATIERRPVDRPASPGDLDALRDRTVEIQETAEKAVVNKTARGVEEVMVGKEVSERTEIIEDTVRHTEINVDRGEASSLRPYEEYEPDYRQDFQTRYAAQGGSYSYDDYAPAYRYGHTLAGDSRYQGRDWQSIEPEARRDWESQYPESTWDRFQMAIQQGWERVTGKTSKRQ